MVLDTLTNLPSYNALNSHFAKVCAYLKEAHLSGLPEGRYPIDGDNAYLMISERDLKKPADAALEVHDRYIDIQIVLSGREGFGWKDRSRCAAPRGAMNTERTLCFTMTSLRPILPSARAKSGSFSRRMRMRRWWATAA